jgi:aminopeptidase-like protein
MNPSDVLVKKSDIGSEIVAGVGSEMYSLAAELYPTCRSITGEGTRRTLRTIQDRIGIDIHAVPSGTTVFDWEVPVEWNVDDAYVCDAAGQRLIDFREHNLHVVNYSEPVRATLTFDELRPHLHSLPGQPDLIPYRTSYYNRSWGFCVEHEKLELMPRDGSYEVVIDSRLEAGQLNYGELVLEGISSEEVLFSTHVCHPSLANDNLSGIALQTFLAEAIAGTDHRLTYRFLFVPGTIGAITWLARNERIAQRVRHGLVVACVGDAGKFNYKRSRRGDADIDRVVEHVLACRAAPYEIRNFSPYGYDERQYCSPGFNLPVGSLTRTPHGEYPEYHTSADNLDLISAESLEESLQVYLEVVSVLESNRRYESANPKCEPQLGRRGLYGHLGGSATMEEDRMAMLWLLNLSDGEHDLLSVAQRAKLPYRTVERLAAVLVKFGLLSTP